MGNINIKLYDVLKCPLCGNELIEGETKDTFICANFPDCIYKTRFVDKEKYAFKYKHNIIKISSLSFRKKKVSGRKLISTDDFKYGKFEIEQFNPLQSKVFQHIDKEENLVIKAPTSSGKTIVAEMFIMKAFSNNKKAIYLSPFKAISNEKYIEWKKRFGEDKVGMLTGDTQFLDRREELSKKKPLIMTIELLHYRLVEYREDLDKGWMFEISVIIVDEAHILYVNDRGNQLESLLMEISAINPNIRIVLLSATISNLSSLFNSKFSLV